MVLESWYVMDIKPNYLGISVVPFIVIHRPPVSGLTSLWLSKDFQWYELNRQLTSINPKDKIPSDSIWDPQQKSPLLALIHIADVLNTNLKMSNLYPHWNIIWGHTDPSPVVVTHIWLRSKRLHSLWDESYVIHQQCKYM